MLGGTVTDVTLLDVTNFSLGIETTGRKYAKLIPKGSTVPVVRSQMVSTVIDTRRPSASMSSRASHRSRATTSAWETSSSREFSPPRGDATH